MGEPYFRDGGKHKKKFVQKIPVALDEGQLEVWAILDFYIYGDEKLILELQTAVYTSVIGFVKRNQNGK